MVSNKVFTKDQREPIFLSIYVIALGYAKKYLNENNKCCPAGKEYCFLTGLILIFTPESPSLLKESFPWEVRKIICSFIIMNSNELS